MLWLLSSLKVKIVLAFIKNLRQNRERDKVRVERYTKCPQHGGVWEAYKKEEGTHERLRFTSSTRVANPTTSGQEERSSQ